MKKTKHITITLSEDHYAQLERQAEKERRHIAQMAGLMIRDILDGETLKNAQAQSISGYMRPAHFIKR